MKKPTPFGKYFLLERINVGGMAEVFRAKAFGVEGFERLVAVKRILPNIAEDKEFIRMFIEEAKLSVQLNHANIAQIFDLGVVDGSYYIALEHVHGRDLRGIFDRCRNLGEPMPVAQACFIAMKVCEGLDYAHNKRDQAGRELTLVHRDVSPQNILVSFEGEVKIIDFGIAKAAGKGSKTQAGILKGKFGYMSPEQVRGLPVDRRSDVFSCGIVLYELLTGERLFVGESDFSTLEKVRNVEILPPSTYNRRIPDELERIVLKALSKDGEDRYQNAIDLHDELQAFVYTAGEFYSRKDLAGWMKKTFGKEIEEETAKLESYRQLKPPTDAPVVTRAATGSRPIVTSPPTAPPPARKSMTMNAVGSKPPPPPPRTTGAMAAVAAPSQSMKLPSLPPGASPRTDDSGDLVWDDDELETQIYDNPEDDPKLRGGSRPSAKLPLAAPAQSQPGLVPTAAPNAPTASAPLPSGPDLSSLASSSRGWNAAEPLPPPDATLNGLGVETYVTTTPKLATGSNKVPSPYEPPLEAQPGLAMAAPTYPFSPPRESIYAGGAEPHFFDPMASFGQGVTARKKGVSGVLLIAIGGVALAAVAVVAVILLSNNSGSSASGKTNDSVAQTTGSQAVAAPQAPVGDQNTGFDLYVLPGGVTQWRLDGEVRTDRLPSRIRGISPGPHTVAIDAPPGFVGGSQVVQVDAGKAQKVEIALAPIENLMGIFDSTPPGAEVSLIVDGKRQSLGSSPAKAKLDPRMTYQVLFEKQGYVSVNRPIVFTGSPEEKIIVNLEKATPVAVETPEPKRTPPVTPPIRRNPGTDKPPGDKMANVPPVDKPPVDKPPVDKPPVDKPPVDKPPVDKPSGGGGSLTLGSKPPCDIFIDGKATGQHTPARDIKLSVGRHRVTLMNNEFGIKETFNVDIKADTPEKMIKDYSDRLPK